ncbi:MAG TPA: helix-turn-helix transcriptional regulator [Candidatus Thermoplasmatota archaeon]
MARKEWTAELKKGTVQLGILALLEGGRRYGFDIIGELRGRSRGYLDLKEGTLYPALHRLEKQGLLKAEWVLDEGGAPPRKYYSITADGRRSLDQARREWKLMVDGLSGVLTGTGDGPERAGGGGEPR